MTQAGKHRIFDGIPQNLLKSSINTFYSWYDVSNGCSIILCQFEGYRSNVSTKMTTTGKHKNIPLNFVNSLKTDSKLFKWYKYTLLQVGRSGEM